MYLCAYSLGVLPARAANYFDIRAVVLDANGTQLGVIERSIGTATRVGWVFVLAMPFAGVGMTSQVQDAMRSILLEGVESGWI